jgi:pimeloyl-ACP methyl ester carboxylesterase
MGTTTSRSTSRSSRSTSRSTSRSLAYVDNGGVRIAYESHGDGDRTVLLLPPWAISHRGIWEQQLAALARRHRVVTFDPRGNGASDRPLDPAAHAPQVLVTDALAVLDAVGADGAVVVGNSYGAAIAYLLAALHPARVDAAVFINPSSLNLDGRTDDPFQQALLHFTDEIGDDGGWSRLNLHSWRRDYAGFVRWFVGQARPRQRADRGAHRRDRRRVTQHPPHGVTA